VSLLGRVIFDCVARHVHTQTIARVTIGIGVYGHVLVSSYGIW
jgi:hypothetical protein